MVKAGYKIVAGFFMRQGVGLINIINYIVFYMTVLRCY